MISDFCVVQKEKKYWLPLFNQTIFCYLCHDGWVAIPIFSTNGFHFKNIIFIEKNLQVKDSNNINPQLDLACKSFLGIINIFISDFKYSFLGIHLDLIYQKSIITSLKSKGNFPSIKIFSSAFPLGTYLPPSRLFF